MLKRRVVLAAGSASLVASTSLAQCLAPHVMGTTAVDAGETHRFWPEQQFTSF